MPVLVNVLAIAFATWLVVMLCLRAAASHRRATRLIAEVEREHRMSVASGQHAADMALLRRPVILPATLGPCSHPDAVPVDLLVGGHPIGERVAWLCPNPKCDAQLPADWRRSATTR